MVKASVVGRSAMHATADIAIWKDDRRCIWLREWHSSMCINVWSSGASQHTCKGQQAVWFWRVLQASMIMFITSSSSMKDCAPLSELVTLKMCGAPGEANGLVDASDWRTLVAVEDCPRMLCTADQAGWASGSCCCCVVGGWLLAAHILLFCMRQAVMQPTHSEAWWWH